MLLAHKNLSISKMPITTLDTYEVEQAARQTAYSTYLANDYSCRQAHERCTGIFFEQWMYRLQPSNCISHCIWLQLIEYPIMGSLGDGRLGENGPQDAKRHRQHGPQPIDCSWVQLSWYSITGRLGDDHERGTGSGPRGTCRGAQECAGLRLQTASGYSSFSVQLRSDSVTNVGCEINHVTEEVRNAGNTGPAVLE